MANCKDCPNSQNCKLYNLDKPMSERQAAQGRGIYRTVQLQLLAEWGGGDGEGAGVCA